MDNHTSFGHWLKYQRTHQFLTQAALARKVGCAVVTLRKIEANTLRPSTQMTTRLIRALNVADHERPRLLALARGESVFPTAALPPTPPAPLLLPTPLTPLLGRNVEVAAACALLNTDIRLLSLTGPGGIGKTRLAIQIATQLRENFPGGACFVDLAPLQDPTLVLATIANTLQIREQANLTLQDLLIQYLNTHPLLLVLDNFEHLLASAALITSLLSAVPSLKVLVTSRIVLRLSGEYVVTVPPLDLPTTNDPLSPTTITNIPAVALFVARARAANLHFTLNERTATAIAAICTRLDGLPLAIELAAARCRQFTPATLLARLEQRLSLLTYGAHDLPARQQTLRATLAWSDALLNTAERTLFRRLAIFTGGSRLEAIEAVLFTGPLATSNIDEPLDHLLNLLDHSLLFQHEDRTGQTRFGMLETIREYAWEQLVASGELTELQARHSAYYLAFAEQAVEHFEGPEQAYWLHQLTADHDNLRAALTWAFSPTGNPQLALRLAVALERFWILGRFYREGHNWLTAALTATPEPSRLRAWALEGLGWIARQQGNMQAATQYLETSLTLFRTLDDTRGMMDTLGRLGSLTIHCAIFSQAKIYMTESLNLARMLNDEPSEAWALLELGRIAWWQTDFETAQHLYRDSLALFRALNRPHGIAWALWHAANAANAAHDYPYALALITECQSLFRQIDDTFALALALYVQGEIAQSQGNYASALAYCAQSRNLLDEQEDKTEIARILLTQGIVAELDQDFATARTCYTESLHLSSQVENPRGKAQALLRLSAVALLEEDDCIAHQLLTDYTDIMQTLELPRQHQLGICWRDAALVRQDPERARACLEQRFAAFRAEGEQWGSNFALRMLTHVLIHTQAYALALTYAHAGLTIAHALNDQIGVVFQLSAIATIALHMDAPIQAAQLSGAVEVLSERLGVGYVAATHWPLDRAQVACTFASLRVRFHNPQIAQAWSIGRSYSLTTAVATALTFASEPQISLYL